MIICRSRPGRNAAITAEHDDRVAVVQIFSFGGRGVREAAQKALAGSEADLQAFLESGWQEPLEHDQRVRVTQIVSFGGPQVKKEGTTKCSGR